MTGFAFSLVVVSIFSHAYMSYLVKISGQKQITITLSLLLEAIFLFIPASIFINREGLNLEIFPVIAIGAGMCFLSYFFLNKAYEHGDLSLVYPMSRLSPIFLPFLSYFLIKETIGVKGFVAMAFIIMGTITMHLKKLNLRSMKNLIFRLNDAPVIYALLSALVAAAYTAWNKISTASITPFVYYFFYVSMTAIFNVVFCATRFSRREIKSSWKRNKLNIVQGAFANGLTSALVLFVMSFSNMSYVGSLRQLGVLVALFISVVFLDERLTPPKIAGACISVTGAIILYFTK